MVLVGFIIFYKKAKTVIRRSTVGIRIWGPALVTKADLEALGVRITNELRQQREEDRRRIDALEQRLNSSSSNTDSSSNSGN